MAVKQLSVFLENKAGKLAEFASVLSSQGLNLRAISIAETADFGIARIIVDDVLEAATLLKNADYICSITDVLAVEIADESGKLAEAISVLGKESINIEYMYAILGTKNNVAYMIIRTNDETKAEGVLKANGFKLVDNEALK